MNMYSTLRLARCVLSQYLKVLNDAQVREGESGCLLPLGWQTRPARMIDLTYATVALAIISPLMHSPDDGAPFVRGLYHDHLCRVMIAARLVRDYSDRGCLQRRSCRYRRPPAHPHDGELLNQVWLLTLSGRGDLIAFATRDQAKKNVLLNYCPPSQAEAFLNLLCLPELSRSALRRALDLWQLPLGKVAPPPPPGIDDRRTYVDRTLPIHQSAADDAFQIL